MKIIKLVFNTLFHFKALNIWLLILRIAVGALMLTHGIPKFQQLISGDEIKFMDPIGLGVKMSFLLVIFAEFFCSILLILGIFTRLAVIPLIFAMLVATFGTHGADPFSAKELTLLYIFIFSTLLITGSGKYSIDHFICKKLYPKHYSF